MITIHQPEHVPWLGLFDKVSKCDTFVILDNVQFVKNYFHNRNRIGTEENPVWITVPIKKHPLNTAIKDVEIAETQNGKQSHWRESYLDKITRAYKDCDYYNEFFPIVKSWVSKEWKSIGDMNISMLYFLLEHFKIRYENNLKIVLASELGLPEAKASDLVLSICKTLNADKYLSGQSGPDYLTMNEFTEAGIEVVVNKPQLSKLSSFDTLFRYGYHNFN